MKISASREAFLKPLQAVIGVVERRQTMPVLANVLIDVKENKEVSITATDLEVELVARTHADDVEPGSITVPGRKLLDICRALPSECTVKMATKDDRLILTSGRSRFALATLSAGEFPVVEDISAGRSLTLSQSDVGRLLDKTHFAMAQQDVRYYLNGLLLETGGDQVRAVATDGHRLALCEVGADGADDAARQIIVPRKGVIELQRLLGGGGDVSIEIGTNHLRVEVDDIRLTSKLIDGRFPDYDKVIPRPEGNRLIASRDFLRQALQRAAILSNEKYRGIRLDLGNKSLRIQANNPDQEEAQDEIEVDYTGDQMEIGFNVNYLLDALAAVDSEEVELGFVDANSSCVIRGPESEKSTYVVMPMRL